jgi:ABC-type transport system involved in cytochrome c biogenesis permease component
MTFLPIVERELRVASRRRLTYWSRVVAAGFLLVIFGMILPFFSWGPLGRAMPWSMGQVIFSALKWIAFVFAAGWGVFLPSDSLSEEKREGTLGLLFLTDLRGYDVVFGKLISLGLQSFYGLLAGFPILALPLLAGGVTGLEFWRSVLVVCNTLFLSLAIGLLVSSMSREVMKAMNAAICLSLVFLMGLPWLDLALAHWDSAKWKCVFSIASPGYLFKNAPGLWPRDYWECLVAQHLVAWIFLVAACIIVPRAWQEKANAKDGFAAALANRWRFGGKRARLAFRRKLLHRKPILWLALRDHWMPRFTLAITFLVVGLLVWNVFDNWGDQAPLRYVAYTARLLGLGLTIWIGSQAARLCLESVRSGAMELMLVTPMPPEQIVRSQWSALWRTFWLPAALVLALMVVDGVDNIIVMKKTFAKTGAVPPNFDFIKYQIVGLCGQSVNFVFRLAALAWFGMWMGLTNRKITIAVLKIVLFVCVIPWIAEMFVQVGSFMIFAFGSAASGGAMPLWVAMIPSALVELGKNIFFIVWSRKRLLTRFRETVAETGQSTHQLLKDAPAPVPAIAPRPLVS